MRDHKQGYVVPETLSADRLISSLSELPHAIAAVGTQARAAAAFD